MNNLKNFITGITEISERSWVILQACLTEIDFKKNEPLLKEGQICHSIYFVSSGYCKSFHNIDGREINTAFYFENEFATNIRSLTTSSKSQYTIKACEKMKVITQI